MRTREPQDKEILNRAEKEFEEIAKNKRNVVMQDYLEGQTVRKGKDYFLCKAIAKLRTT